MIDITKVSNIELDGIDHNDYPDYCDAFVSSALYDGEEMTDTELDDLNENYGEWIHEKIMDFIF